MRGFARFGSALVVASMTMACVRSTQERRELRVRGIPVCPHAGAYARPIVVRIDRDAALFEEAYEAATTLELSSADGVVMLPVPRVRGHSTIRAGLCASTSLGTWDCKAPSWLVSMPVTLDARADATFADLPFFEAACADGQTARPAVTKK